MSSPFDNLFAELKDIVIPDMEDDNDIDLGEGSIEKSREDIFAQLRASLRDPEKQKEHRRVYKAEWKRNRYAKKKKDALEHIAILDMETDPFDNEKETPVFPFLAVLHSDQFEDIIIWDEDYNSLCCKVITAIENLPGSFTIYAHNGGKFDFYFLLHKLRGEVKFKGRSIMTAQIGNHELRDSFHIIPERLAHFEKGKIDYQHMAKEKRNAYKSDIIKYCIQDCAVTLRVVKEFLNRFGFKLSIGAAALAELRKSYKLERITKQDDKRLRPYFHGGRVECIQGSGVFEGNFRLYDVNSMYPAVMASERHPIGRNYEHLPLSRPDNNTFFVRLRCDNNGALMMWDEASKELTCNVPHGEFYTTIHEYNTALELGLITNVEIITCVQCDQSTTFEKFVNPLYAQRMGTKKQLKELIETVGDESSIYITVKTDDTFFKLILNNAYGKTAQNPERYKEHFICDVSDKPPADEGDVWKLVSTTAEYAVYERPSQSHKYLNVGTGASITGAARARLMRAKHFAKNPIYCDTDSLICEELRNEEIHNEKLGAWKIEAELSRVAIAGKKLYAYRMINGKEKVKSKGAAGLSMIDIEDLALHGAIKIVKQTGVTIYKNGDQKYGTRTVRATAKPMKMSA